MEKKKCIHEGHRGRLIDTVYKGGLDNLSDVQIAEFMLFYIMPRGDVNPLAHRLLDRFGNVANIIDADENELASIEGIGMRSAKALTGLNKLFDHVAECRASKNDYLGQVDVFCDYFEELLRFMTVENMYIVGFDSKFRVIGKKKLTAGTIKNVGVVPQAISTFLISTKPAAIVIAHNHPQGSCVPSEADCKATDHVRNLVESMNIGFIDHVIVAEDGIYSIVNKKFLRTIQEMH